MLKMIDVERECLKFAWEIISGFTDRREYGRSVLRYSRRAGTMILSDGLPATLAFAYSKAKREEAWKEVSDCIVRWLYKRGLIKHKFSMGKEASLEVFKELSDMENWKILMAEKEATRVLNWLAKLCEGEFGEES